MDLSLKIILFSAILVGDVVAAHVLTRKLNAQGQGEKAKIILPVMLGGLMIIGVVLFVVL
ncbi:MAG: hypothetical protein FJY97_18115 [candidate division Zixibacteria bacterium]|nr:hypothetical protein [candidate division Zixibacteria bacterium]